MKSVEDTKKLIEATDLLALAMLDADPDSIMGELSYVVGHVKAMQLIDMFGGLTITFPTKQKLAESVKHACIWVDYDRGKMSIDELCSKYSMTTGKIWKIIDRWTGLNQVGLGNG